MNSAGREVCYQARILALESEVSKCEEALEEAKDYLSNLEEQCKLLKAENEHPMPPCDFGRKGEKWSYKVFGLACELLCLRLTCQQCTRVTEVFLRFFYPKARVRVPSSVTFEKWRSMMYRIVKFVNVKVPFPLTLQL